MMKQSFGCLTFQLSSEDMAAGEFLIFAYSALTSPLLEAIPGHISVELLLLAVRTHLEVEDNCTTLFF